MIEGIPPGNLLPIDGSSRGMKLSLCGGRGWNELMNESGWDEEGNKSFPSFYYYFHFNLNNVINWK